MGVIHDPIILRKVNKLFVEQILFWKKTCGTPTTHIFEIFFYKDDLLGGWMPSGGPSRCDGPGTVYLTAPQVHSLPKEPGRGFRQLQPRLRVLLSPVPSFPNPLSLAVKAQRGNMEHTIRINICQVVSSPVGKSTQSAVIFPPV